MKKTIEDIDVRGRRVLLRLDLNVPQDASQRITDDRRIRAALPTIRRALDEGGRATLISHLGRPKTGDTSEKAKFSLAPVAQRLSELLGRPVRFVPDCIGDLPRSAVAGLRDGQACLLENLRFHQAETIKDKDATKDPTLAPAKEAFARALADLADVYLNDAFGTCHRDNASMLAVPRLMAGKPRVIGYLVERELRFLGEALSKPRRPFVCLLGGAKVSDKLGVIQALLSTCDRILIGGAMAYTFLAADGVAVGKSLVESDLLVTARKLLASGRDRLRLPVDSIAAEAIQPGALTEVCDGAIASHLMGLDIGPKTVEAYANVLASARTIFWNGPMGVFETPPFDAGTLAMAHAVAGATSNGATTIVGGGDTAAAVDQAGVADRITHISTGGGAALEFLEGKRFAALDVLDDA